MVYEMGCFAVPLGAAICHMFLRNKIHSLKGNVHQVWLSLLLVGGALFGVIDHLWNGELFLLGNIVADLLLGITITVSIVAAWAVIVVLDNTKQISPSKTRT